MRIYYDYEREELLTEQEAKEYTKEDVLNDDYGIWEFITDNYYYEAIMSHFIIPLSLFSVYIIT